MPAQVSSIAVERVPIRYRHLRDCIRTAGPFSRMPAAEVGVGSGRVRPDDAEIGARRDCLVFDAGGDGDDVARRYRHLDARLPSEADGGAAAEYAERLVSGAVEESQPANQRQSRRMTNVPGWPGWGVSILLGLVVVAAAAFLWLRGSLPEIDGERILPGLAAPVEVIRDANGIPHITAESEDDALFALGFVHAQDRMWQMEMNRRIGAGRLSEVLGPAALDTDRLLRVLGLRLRARTSLDHLSPASRRRIAAYVRGVNAWLDARKGPLPPEFLVLGFEPERWSPVDSAQWPKIMSLDLAREWTRDRMRLRLSETLSPDRIIDFYTPYRTDKPRGVVAAPAGAASAPIDSSAPAVTKRPILPAGPDPAGNEPPTTAPAFADRSVSRMLSALPSTGGHLGSNGWAVDGTRTSTGKPLLANDPHLSLTAPSPWYLVHLSWPGVDIVGATFPGMPVVVLGHNGRVAWGFTNTGPDVQDLFVEKTHPSDSSRYLAPDGWRTFDMRRERIRVKDGEDVVLEVRESRHGPILDDVRSDRTRGDGPGRVLSLAWTALRDDDLTLQAGLGFPHARDWESFVANARYFHSPQQNISYADVDGNIGFLAPGLIPIRGDERGGRPGTVPRPGWDASYDWRGFVPFEELPRVYNPPGGVIVTANHQIVPDDYPHHLTFEWAGGYRAQRIMEQLAERARHDMESFRRLQQDRVSLFARSVLPRLRRVAVAPGTGAAAVRARALLDDWDGSMDPDRPEPLVFHAWIWEFGRLVTADDLGALQREAWGRKGPFIQRALEERTAWCDDRSTAPVETCDEMLVRALVAATARLARGHGDDPDAWRWGDEHVAISEHRPFGQTPLAPLFNLSGEVPGSMYAVNAFSFSPLDDAQPFASTHGPGFRAIYDLADLDRSLFIHSTGQSGNVLSSWYRSFEKGWRDGGYITIPIGRAAYESNAAGRLRLVPSRAHTRCGEPAPGKPRGHRRLDRRCRPRQRRASARARCRAPAVAARERGRRVQREPRALHALARG